MRETGILMTRAFGIVLMAIWSEAAFLSAQDGGHGAPIPLVNVVTEAENNNTQIAAADHAWRAAAQFAAQDVPQLNPQPTQRSLSVADLEPHTDLGNDDSEHPCLANRQASSHSAAVNVRGEVDRCEADTQHAQIGTVRSIIVDRVRTIYLRLAYLYQMYDLDDRGADDLATLIQNELSKYGQGIGSQSEVLQAQVERTKLLRETTKHHEEVGGLQAELKGLLHREPDSPDVIPEPLAFTKLRESSSELLAQSDHRNPALVADRAIIDAQISRLDLVRSGVEPDSAAGFMLRHTDVDDPDNYLLILKWQLSDRQDSREGSSDAEIAQAAERLESSRSEASEDRLRQLAEVQKQYTVVTSSEELMRECKEGLIPQSKAVYESKLASYQLGREGFGSVIEAFLDQIAFEDDYLQAILEHETALAHLEVLTGEKLR